MQIQFTFDEDQVDADEDQVDADEDDPTPTNKALVELQNELLEHIGQNYAVDSIEIENGADGCLLLSVVDDDE